MLKVLLRKYQNFDYSVPNMQQSQDINLNALRVFVSVAEQRSYTAAATSLGMQKSTVSRTISDLEHSLGIKLLYRTTRQIELTSQGKELFAECHNNVARLVESMRATMDTSRRIEGKVRLAAVHDMGVVLLSPIIREFSERYPKLQIELLCDDDVVNLVSEAIDISIRVGKIDQTSFYVRKVGHVEFIFVASPKFVERSSAPWTVDNIHQANFLAYQSILHSNSLRISKSKEVKRVKVTPQLVSRGTLAILDMTLGGMGISALPDFLVRDHIKHGNLLHICRGWQAFSKPVNVVTQATKKLSPQIAVLTDFITKRLSEKLDPSNH